MAEGQHEPVASVRLPDGRGIVLCHGRFDSYAGFRSASWILRGTRGNHGGRGGYSGVDGKKLVAIIQVEDAERSAPETQQGGFPAPMNATEPFRRFCPVFGVVSEGVPDGVVG